MQRRHPSLKELRSSEVLRLAKPYLQDILEKFKKEGIVSDFLIFGSIVYDKDTKHSDIDLMALVPKATPEIFAKIQEELDRRIMYPVHILLNDNGKNCYIPQKIQNEAIPLCDWK